MAMAEIAALAGSIVGKLYDPLAWLVLAVCLGLGIRCFGLRWALLVAVAATILNVLLVWSWWAELGATKDWAPRSFNLLVVHAVLALAGYWLGWLLQLARKRITRSQR